MRLPTGTSQTITGDLSPPPDPDEPYGPAAGNVARTTLNSAVNPNSYANRDYRMKSTIQWDYEVSMGSASQVSTGMVPFIYRPGRNGHYRWRKLYHLYTDGCNSGYVFRKFGPQLCRTGSQRRGLCLAGHPPRRCLLMYAEATNEISGPQPMRSPW